MMVFLKGSNPYVGEFRRKTWENSERLCKQDQPGIESGTSRLTALRADPLGHWWRAVDGMHNKARKLTIYKIVNEHFFFKLALSDTRN